MASTSFDLWPTATRIANEEGVDPALFRALIRAESGGRHFTDGGGILTSSAGALGFAQLMPGTASGLGVNPKDPIQNLRGGARYLAQQLKAFNGNIRFALAAYNAGPGAVQKYGGIPPYAETQAYVKRVLGYKDEYPGGGSGASVSNDWTPTSADPGTVGYESTGNSFRDEIIKAIEKPGRVTTKDLIQLEMLRRQQAQDQRTQAEVYDAEVREGQGTKKGKPPNRKAGASQKEWGQLKGVGNTSPDFMLMAINKAIELGLSVRENPYVDPVDPVHVEGSFHFQNFPGTFNGKKLGRAIDLNGSAEAKEKFFRWAIKYRPSELFWDPLGQYDNGRYSSAPIGGHDHVHLSV